MHSMESFSEGYSKDFRVHQLEKCEPDRRGVVQRGGVERKKQILPEKKTSKKDYKVRIFRAKASER